jgi:hypothetical protein
MGACFDKSARHTSSNQIIDDDANQFEPEPIDPETIHALVCYVDYGFEPAKSQGWCPPAFGHALDTAENAQIFAQLLRDCGCSSIQMLANQQCTKENMVNAIHQVGAKCDSNDVFVFFYSGHGAPMPDQDGDEDDGMDEAMCLPDVMGNCHQGTWLRDDYFSDAVCRISAGHKLVVLDCCHSGTMLDLDHHKWGHQVAVCMSGCRDAEEAAAMGGGTRGGAFTKALDYATRSLGHIGATNAAAIHNVTLQHAMSLIPPGHRQAITLSCPPGVYPQQIQWPLCLEHQ